jgi:hypothetical protein
MPSRPFGYNPSQVPINGTTQLQDLAIGVDNQDYSTQPGGIVWWMGPDEDLGYVIASVVASGNQPTPLGPSGTVKFWRTKVRTDEAFIGLSQYVSYKAGSPQTFLTTSSAKQWLNTNGFWTSFVTGPSATNLIMYWDIQQSASYSGTGSTITDLSGNSDGTITGSIAYTSGSPNYLTIEGGTSEYIYTENLNPYLSPVNTGTAQSVFLWIYPTSNGIIYSEQGSLTPDSSWYDAQIQRSSSGNFLFAVWPYSLNSPLITSPLTYPLNNWYYVGWTYNGTSLRAFVNGSAVGSVNITRNTPYNNGGALPMYFNLGYPTSTDIGNTTSCTYRLGGMHIYNIGLSSGTVLQNYDNTKTNYGL